jgi:hypothetical protein
MQIAAGCKHFVANSLEDWGNHTRHNFNAHVSLEDLYNYYFPPFQTCASQSLGLMCSYNAVNGVPSCINNWLLRKVLREEWGFQGYVVTDCGALSDVVNGHHSAIDPIQTSALALNATTDVNCGNGVYYPKALLQAYQQGYVSSKQVQESFERLARVQLRLGLFDPKNESIQDDMSAIDSPRHQELAYEAALQSMVLLKNSNQILPLSRESQSTLAVIGPHIHATSALLSNYHGGRCCDACGYSSRKGFDCIETPLQALVKANAKGTTMGVEGCHVEGTDLDEIDKAIAVAKDSDIIVVLIGLDQSQEREGKDRIETTLPFLQTKLVKAILNLNKPNTILVLLNGGALSLGSDILERAPVILDAFYGGQAGSRAIASILFGDYNPTGKLAATMYPPSYVDEIPMTEMGVNVGVGRTHMYYKGQAEFAFGHGLSYSEWQLTWTDSTYAVLKADEPLNLQVKVVNVGPFPGSETVLLFWRPLDSQVDIRQKFVAFVGTEHLEVGEHRVLDVSFKYEHLALWKESLQGTAVATGMYELEARGANGVKVTRRLFVDGELATS